MPTPTPTYPPRVSIVRPPVQTIVCYAQNKRAGAATARRQRLALSPQAPREQRSLGSRLPSGRNRACRPTQRYLCTPARSPQRSRLPAPQPSSQGLARHLRGRRREGPRSVFSVSGKVRYASVGESLPTTQRHGLAERGARPVHPQLHQGPAPPQTEPLGVAVPERLGCPFSALRVPGDRIIALGPAQKVRRKAHCERPKR